MTRESPCAERGNSGVRNPTSFEGSRGTAVSSDVVGQAQYKPISETPPRPKSTTGPSSTDSMTVGVNETADTAFRSVTKPSALNETLEDAYTVEVALETDKHRLGGGPPGTPSSPGTEWTLVADRTTTTTEAVGNASGRVATPDGWHALETFSRTVERRTRGRRLAERVSTSAHSYLMPVRYRVTVAVVGRHHGRSPAPNRSIRTAPMPARVR
ncbi:hypothetical protein C8039_09820 [Halogeometricum sp. wsp3]|nr:hypothetical protein C8039_09820 [Halogeometricum sp. wsp3]